MRRIRFTIAGLLGVILCVAVAFAALREATDVWDSGLLTLTVGLLLTSILLATHRAGIRRAYWQGFALFGAVYLVASLVPAIEPRLLTTKGLAFVDAKIPGRDRAVSVVLGMPATTTGGSTAMAPGGPWEISLPGETLVATTQGTVRLWSVQTTQGLAGPLGSSANFVRIGHSLLALLVAFFGGRLSRCLALGRRRPADAPAASHDGDAPVAANRSA
jgi:hypothetical protein